MIALIIYVCMSATGLTLIKIGTMRKSTLSISAAGFDLGLSWILLVGFCIYVLSFLMSLVVMKRMNLTLFYPLSAGLIYILVSLAGFIVLKENVSIAQFIGMGIILAGIVVMNLGKGIA